ncbi:MAG: ATP-binding cassette domain-containing protein [Bacteroidales bacterium]|nr:ATP-binding cassette domain-containing protein [Bacteroidales bacterium]
MNLLETHGLEKRYGNYQALTDLSVAVPQGSIYGLLGPNGAGKTTLIRIINQITGPDSGEVLFDGKPLSSSDIYRIGYLPEERGLYRKMKVGEQALFLAQLKGLDRATAIKRLRHWFEKFGIQGWWDKRVEELSKGMAQKVQFMVTVIHEPELLIFDEPFSGFDPINAQLIRDEIMELRKNGTTIIFSTHNMASVEEMCDHITLINKSRSILSGPIDEVRRTHGSNVYSVAYRGSYERIAQTLQQPGSGIELMAHHTDGTTPVLHLRSALDSTNALLQQLMPLMEVVALNPLVASMNDIFITAVKDYNQAHGIKTA